MTFYLSIVRKHFFLISLYLFVCGSTQAESIDVSFLYVGDKNNSAYLGAVQGLSEANLQGEFLGQKYSLTDITADEMTDHIEDSVVAIIVVGNSEMVTRVSSKFPDTAVLNVAAEDDELRQHCSTNQLHIIPSQQMKADALAQWLEKQPDSKAVAQAWHPKFVKFAARDLNKRYKKAHGIPMDDNAWAGWAAVKMVSDTVARENITERAAILDYLKTQLAFDGQKGLNMSFRKTGQLRQPILIVDGDKILTEAPVRGVAKPPTVESLGLLDCH